MLVGKSEPSCTDRLATCQCLPSGRTTPSSGLAAIAQPPITWALTTFSNCGSSESCGDGRARLGPAAVGHGVFVRRRHLLGAGGELDLGHAQQRAPRAVHHEGREG
jgi:hypothetical protein